MRIALLGGAFDPPHHGHALCVNKLLESKLIDEVWITPSGERVDKRYCVEPHHRRKMATLFVESLNDPRIKFFPIQIDELLPGSYTIDLIRYLNKEYVQHEFFVIIGTELVRDIPRWKEAEALLKEASFLVITRPSEVAPKLMGRMTILPDPEQRLSSLSSTAIRERLRRGELDANALAPDVAEYIRAHGLYADKKE